ncbi:HYR domain-containing protein [Flavobacteriaceae bacterium]|nr:HYR domain-containing protein [Flavobacteriaceae bacterium]
MKKHYTTVLQILLICLLSITASFASNSPNTTSPSVVDNLALDIECPVSFTESATPSCEFILPDYTALASITGAGAEPVITQSPLPSSLYGLGTITVTLTANDGTSEVSCSFDVQVIDTTSPSLTCPVDQFAVTDENCEFIIPDYTPLGSAVDFCSAGNIPVTQNPAPGTVVSVNTMVFLLATDSNGNTGACSFNVILSDVIPPSIVCPQDREEEATIDCLFTIPDYTSLANANDNCATVLVTQSPGAGTQVGIGVTQITLTATDGPNTTTCVFNITVLDTSPPIVTCPEDQLEDYDVNCQFLLPDYRSLATITDTCYPGPFTVTQVPAPGTLISGNVSVAINATDNAGNTGSCSFMVLQNDVIPPTITCPSNQIEEVNAANCMFIIPDYTALATAQDGCNDQVVITQSPAPGTQVGLGATTITLTASDGFNTANCTFEIEVQNTSTPNAVCSAPFNLPLNADGNATLTPSQVDGGSNAYCDIASMSIDITTFNCDDLGPHPVTLTIIDTNGNTSSCTTTVTITDPLFACNELPTALCQALVVSANENCQGEATAQDFDNGSFDPDNTPFTLTVSPQGPYPLGTTTVVLTIDDGEYTDSCDTTITVVDTTAPSLTCLENQVVAVDTACSYVVPNYLTQVTAQDNCGVVSVLQSPLPGTTVSTGVTQITITANDGVNQSVCTFNLTIEDQTAPTATAQNITVALDIDGYAEVEENDIDAGSSDNCGAITKSLNTTIFTCDEIGQNEIILTITDQGGLQSTATAIVTVVDTMAPQIFTQDIIVYLDANGEVSITAQDIDAGSTDNCGIVAYSIDTTSFDCSNTGPNQVTLTLTDASANTSASTAIVTVIDAIAPTAVCQNITLELDASGNAFLSPSDIDSGSSDNCTVSQIALSQTSFDCSMIGQNQVVFTITDASGNSSSCTAMVTVENNNVPVAACQNITLQLDSSGVATITAADLDGGSTLTCYQQATIELDQYTFDCNDLGVNEVAFTITETNGLTTSCTALVTVEDTLAPTVVCQNIIVTLDQDGLASIVVADINAGSFDACGIAGMSLDIDTFDCSMIGTNPVTLSVTDVNGNSSACQATVTVVDATYPTAMCQSITLILDQSGLATITPDDLDQGSSDNCSNFTTSVNIDTFDCTNVGQNNVLFTVTDMQGNVSSCNAIVTILDTTAPIMDCQDITVSLEDDLQVTLTLNELFAGWSDNCAIETRTADVTSFDCSNIGENTVTLTAIDSSGNEATCSIIVNIQEGVFAPVAVCQNVTVPLQQDGTASIPASSLDGGSSGVRCQDGYSVNISEFSCADVGTPILVEFTVYNSIGESDTCYAYVNVIDGLAPEITCPADQTITTEGAYSLPDYFATGEALALDNCSTTLVTDQRPSPGTLLENGTYTITLSATDNGGFESTCEFEIVVNDLLSNQDTEILLQDITIYPNPASDIITITNPQFIGLTDVTLFDVTGRKVKHSNVSGVNDAVVINISELRSAMYMVVISTEYGQVVKQLLKK